jgi:hypothetical protein
MTTVAISGLPVATVINAADIVPFVQAGTTKSISKTLLFTSPTMVTPALGTVASGNISACTSTSMVMVTPVLGTPTSGNLSNCTSTSMVLTTPVIGAATGTSLSTTGNQVITGTGKQGYATGAGGAVTQLTSKSTALVAASIDKSCGQITMNNAALAASTTVTFTMPNTTIEAGDILVMNHISGGTAGSYLLNAQSAAGSATINVRNISLASLSEAIVIAFAVIKAVAA